MSAMKEEREEREQPSEIKKDGEKREGEESDDREKERAEGGRIKGRRGVRGTKVRGSRGVVEKSKVSNCWRKGKGGIKPQRKKREELKTRFKYRLILHMIIQVGFSTFSSLLLCKEAVSTLTLCVWIWEVCARPTNFYYSSLTHERAARVRIGF